VVSPSTRKQRVNAVRIAQTEERVDFHQPQAAGAGQFHQMIQREDQGCGLRPFRQPGDREKGAAEEEHRGDEEKNRQVEHVD